MNNQVTGPEVAMKTKKKRWWYYAIVKNSSGFHAVFYATSRPVVGSTCPGIAEPNKIVDYKRELAPIPAK